MKAVLLGYSKLKGVSKKTGNAYDGYSLHLGYQDENVKGTATIQKFVPSDILDFVFTESDIGEMFEFSYEVNFTGYQKLISIEKCPV